MEQRLNAEEFCIDKDFVFIVGTVVSFGFLGFEGLHSGGSFDCSPFVVEFRTLDMCFFALLLFFCSIELHQHFDVQYWT